MTDKEKPNHVLILRGALFKKEAKKLKKQFVVYVFSLNESAREGEFEDVADLVELMSIPAVMLNVCRRIFK